MAAQQTLPLTRPPESICLLRLSALGDVTHVVPVVRTLQTYWPGTRLTWIIGRSEAELVGDLEGIEFIIFDKPAGLTAHRELREQLHARRFDVLLHMQVSLRANIVSRSVNSPVRLGFDRARSKDLHGLFINAHIPHTRGQHVLDGFFSFLESLSLRERELRWDIPISAQTRAFAEQQIPASQPALIISPCSSHAPRNWRADRYAQVADHAAQRWGMRVLVCGRPTRREREYGKAINNHMRQPSMNLIGRTTVKELLALLARASVLLAPDSGPAHMATCVGTPVVGLYAATNPDRACPYFSRRWCIDKYDAAARQYRGKPAIDLTWGTKLEYPGVMDLIEVHEVLGRFDELMSEPHTMRLRGRQPK